VLKVACKQVLGDPFADRIGRGIHDRVFLGDKLTIGDSNTRHNGVRVYDANRVLFPIADPFSELFSFSFAVS
jgi:hypothetical protein